MAEADKLNLKFNARIVDSIERAVGNVSIEHIAADGSVRALSKILEHALWDENAQRYGVSSKVALDTLDAQFEAGRDKYDIMLDVTEALVEAGFLPQNTNVEAMRRNKAEVNEALADIS